MNATKQTYSALYTRAAYMKATSISFYELPKTTINKNCLPLIKVDSETGGALVNNNEL